MLSLPVSITKTSGNGNDPRFDVVGPEGQELESVYVDGDGNQVAKEDTKRAFNGKLFSQEQLKEINDACKIEDLDILEIAPVKSIDQRRIEKVYYVFPHKKNGNPKAFNVFVQALKKVKGAAVVKWTPSSRQELLAIYPDGDSLIAVGLSFAEDFKAPDEDVIGHTDSAGTKQEVELASKLLTAVMGDGSSLDEATDEAIPLKQALLNGDAPDLPEPTKAEPAGADLVSQLESALAEVEKVKS